METLIEVFEEQVRMFPGKKILFNREESWTYEDVNRMANRIAHTLSQVDAAYASDTVGVLFNKELIGVSSIMSVMKANKTYIPMNANYPVQRLIHMLHKTGTRILVTTSAYRAIAEEIREKLDIALVQVDSQDAGSYPNPEHLPAGEKEAYILFTSGSTGQPKAVAQTQAHALSYVRAYIQELNIGPEDKLTYITSFSHDGAIMDMYSGLLSGAALYMEDVRNFSSYSALFEWLHEAGVNVWHSVPTLLKYIVRDVKNTSLFSRFRLVVLGGEHAVQEDVHAFSEAFAHARLYNLYGQTESSFSSGEFFQPHDETFVLTIGKPVNGLKMFVLDEEGTETDFYQTGELVLAGRTLAPGYWGDEEATANKFMKDDAEGTLFWTGDLGYRLPDGRVKYVGRKDNQVKIRGNRVELEEVEVCALKSGRVELAAGRISENSPGDKTLLLYVVLKPLARMEDVYDFLKSHLPDYMIPSRIFSLPSLPLTASGKIDRTLLPDPGEIPSAETPGLSYSEEENRLLNIWCEVLSAKKEQLGLDSRFFNVGGHSLNAMTLIFKIYQEFGVSVSLSEVFNHDTVRKQLEMIRKASVHHYLPVPKANEASWYRLSPAQKRLFLLQQLNPESIVYNMTMLIPVGKDTSGDVLQQALNRLISRHEILRTVFELQDDQPVQRVLPGLTVSLAELQAAQEELHHVQREFVKPFDLSKAPLIRAARVRASDGEHYLLLDMHHIITDLISLDILSGEFRKLCNGEFLPDVTIHYKDYAEWLESDAQKRFLADQESYWLETFKEVPGALSLPYDFNRPPVQSFEGARVTFDLNRNEYHILNKLCADQEVTMYMCLLALLNVLLSKLSGQTDIVVGSAVSSRRHQDLGSAIGMFVNTLALRNFPKDDIRFDAFLKEVKSNTLQAFENQDYAFEELIDRMALSRDISRHPLFDVMFVLQSDKASHGHAPESNDPGAYKHLTTRAKFDLTVDAIEVADGLSLSIEYSSKLFRPETIDRFIGYFRNILKQLSGGALVKLSSISIIGEEERNHLLYSLNATQKAYSEQSTVVDLFERSVHARPQSPALHWQGGMMSYGELDQCSNRLANGLASLKVSTQSHIAIILDRSPQMIVGVMGVLKSGNIYVPLEPSLPDARLLSVLSMVKPPVILTDGANRSKIETLRKQVGYPLSLIVMDGPEGLPAYIPAEQESVDKALLLNDNTSNPEIRIQPDWLAYVIFTSGSTGVPKGVVVKHKPVVNIVEWVNQTFQVSDSDKLLFVTSLSFDLSVYDIFGILAAGASIRIASQSEVKSPDRLYEILKSEGITFWDSAPAALQQLSAFLDESTPETDTEALRLVFLSGDWIPVSLPDKIRRVFKKAEVVSLGGATEATIWSNYYRIGKVDPAWPSIPYGRPIQNAKYYILDSELQPCPYGVSGDLYIGGDCLAEGYMSDQALTASKFIPDPYNPGGRMYRTGDLARWKTDDQMEFLGRKDFQVKIRGYRIELGEIESHLQQHSHIRESVVVALGDKNERVLCAYYISENNIDKAALRDYLQLKLPDYMIPSYFMQIEHIPVTSNGKVDKQALPEPKIDQGNEYIAPETDIEILLADVWSEVLGVDRISVDDNYFMLGGDSIRTIQISSRLSKHGYKIEIRDIFQHPTISKLAHFVKKVDRIADQSAVYGDVPLMPLQKELLSGAMLQKHHFNQAVMLYSALGFDALALQVVFKKLQEHHDALRMVYDLGHGIKQFNKNLDHPLDFQRFDFRNRDHEEELIRNACESIQAAISLDSGPLMRLALFCTDKGDHLLIVIHHLVIDGLSWRILLEDLEMLYQQQIGGNELSLPLKSDSLKSWAEGLSDYANSKRFLEEKEYWANVERKIVPVIVKDQDGSNRISDVETRFFLLGKEHTHALLTQTNKAYRTEINDILISALALGFGRSFEADSLPLVLEGHGRENVLPNLDVGRTVGWFTSMYPVVIDLTHRTDLSRHIKQTKETLHHIPNNGIGYGILKHLTLPENKVGLVLEAVPQICFNYLGQFDADVKDKLTFSVSELPTGAVRSPLQEREYIINVSGIISDGHLQIIISYSNKQFNEDTIHQLIRNYETSLVEIIAHCSEKEVEELTPSDLTFKGLSLEQLDNFFDE